MDPGQTITDSSRIRSYGLFANCASLCLFVWFQVKISGIIVEVSKVISRVVACKTTI